ncbi:hypothetical protein TbgDal_VII5695 [Trypanosoma brucei gambiense DAL972]|uniref:Uncharacterized protein n=1 Tax=Trypanosoma brucei gambiense (strain MHOM/CI/86/DAL972) TaxID=679716 RepID=C9ZTD1_TRYB9|nr:hypothetical protein TbgDal_VII5695 [Trypanosoma brucei gambiense DAL972]CBH12666.1 hypothetical protein TbgDal_VII5695 [Trypanosoma brucei gambiense DAL972]|eukprot:XP_011774946.1 hypothetical protein TbgDal_VII5695 [Trypanosoma brucei gambiense DAL972]
MTLATLLGEKLHDHHIICRLEKNFLGRSENGNISHGFKLTSVEYEFHRGEHRRFVPSCVSNQLSYGSHCQMLAQKPFSFVYATDSQQSPQISFESTTALLCNWRRWSLLVFDDAMTAVPLLSLNASSIASHFHFPVTSRYFRFPLSSFYM